MKIIPAFPGNDKAIVLETDVSYLYYAAVEIQTLIDESDSNELYDIVILHKNIPLTEINRVCDFFQNHRKNISIRFFDVCNLVEKYNLYTERKGSKLSDVSYYRLLCSDILSEEYNTAIHLDCDMAIMTDISKLYEIDLDGFYVAGVREVSGMAIAKRTFSDGKKHRLYHERYENLNLENPDDYIISGLLVMNLTEIRRDYPNFAIMELANSREWYQHDQDVINLICNGGKARILPLEWNILQDFHGNYEFLPNEIYTDLIRALKNPFIAHFGGLAKPWITNIDRDYIFWKAAVKTPFFEIIVSKMVFDVSGLVVDRTNLLWDKDIKDLARKISDGDISSPCFSSIINKLIECDYFLQKGEIFESARRIMAKRADNERNLQMFRRINVQYRSLYNNNDRLNKSNIKLREKNRKLKRKYNELSTKYKKMKEKYSKPWIVRKFNSAINLITKR